MTQVFNMNLFDTYTDSTKKVLSYIAFHSASAARRFELPSLVKDIGLSKTTIRTALSILQKDGFVTIATSKGRTPVIVTSNIRIFLYCNKKPDSTISQIDQFDRSKHRSMIFEISSKIDKLEAKINELIARSKSA